MIGKWGIFFRYWLPCWSCASSYAGRTEMSAEVICLHAPTKRFCFFCPRLLVFSPHGESSSKNRESDSPRNFHCLWFVLRLNPKLEDSKLNGNNRRLLVWL
ncbi:hypothetical protein C8R45DRAFT_955432 [Mycena sanguinolenta]|nr:hypothetical protein C8R45DRAFT_955432 [Mycena sanguinolenta]